MLFRSRCACIALPEGNAHQKLSQRNLHAAMLQWPSSEEAPKAPSRRTGAVHVCSLRGRGVFAGIKPGEPQRRSFAFPPFQGRVRVGSDEISVVEVVSVRTHQSIAHDVTGQSRRCVRPHPVPPLKGRERCACIALPDSCLPAYPARHRPRARPRPAEGEIGRAHV